jgi:carbon-monoxide dehydrogenase small subunit
MTKLSLAINGCEVEAQVEPRRNLADFLREDQFLTGTHIGCEHGVCGACTVLIDGSPARSCITYTLACDGAEVTTIEGLENDPVMARLRRAFSQHHALQCGYCTPGMLISARDIVTRLPQADEARVRRELSGNLCRCTGYVGIVAAVCAVMAEGAAPPVEARNRCGPVGAHAPSAASARSRPMTRDLVAAPTLASPAGGGGSGSARREARAQPSSATAEQWRAVETQGVELVQSIEVPYARDETWRFLGDLNAVTRCIPGARLTAAPLDGHAQGEMHVKLGPIISAFAGFLEVERDDAAFRGVVRGAGSDSKSASNARGIIVYTVKPSSERSSRVDISVKFLLAGALAQFSRAGLVRDVADHITRMFARNLEARMSGAASAPPDHGALDAGALARAAVWNRIADFLRRLFRLKRGGT